MSTLKQYRVQFWLGVFIIVMALGGILLQTTNGNRLFGPSNLLFMLLIAVEGFILYRSVNRARSQDPDEPSDRP